MTEPIRSSRNPHWFTSQGVPTKPAQSDNLRGFVNKRGDDRTAPLARVAKTLIVEALVRLPSRRIQRWAAFIVRVLWPGFSQS